MSQCADCISITVGDMGHLARGWDVFFEHVNQLTNRHVERSVFLS